MKPSLRLVLILSFPLLTFSICSAKTEQDSVRTLVRNTEGIEHIDALNALAGVVIANDLEQADSILNLSTQLATASDHNKGILVSLLLKARVHMHRYSYAEAEQVLKEAENLAIEINDDELQSRVHISLGNLYFKRTRSAEAFDQYLQGLTFANKANDADAQVTNLMNLGRLKEISGDIAKAEEYYLKALDISEVNQLKRRLMELHINMAVVEYKRNNLGLSIEHNQQTYAIANTEGDLEMSALALSNLGFAEGVLGNAIKASEYYDRSLELREKINDQHGIGTIHIYKAKLKGVNEYQEAERLGLKALEIAEEIDDRRLQLEAYSFLYRLAEKRGNSDKTLKYFRGLSEVKDSIDASSNNVKMMELEAAYQFKELQRLNELQQVKMDVAAVKLKLRNAVILALSVILILLTVLFIAMRKQLSTKLSNSQLEKNQIQTKAGKLKEELAQERQRLADYTDKLLQKSLTSLDMQEQESEEQPSEPKRVEALAKMVEQLNTGEVNEKDWLTFNMLFNAAYPNFERTIEDQFKDLTPSDTRLASLMKLKLSNKQVGAILNISRDSVVRAKYRLRQKMAFESNQKMEAFLIEA